MLSEATKHKRSRSVLYVEDDEDIRELLSRRMRAEGRQVVEAGSAEEGLEQLTSQHFAVVLSDYHLPGKTGTWMLNEARARGLLEGTAVLLLTAAVNVEDGEHWQRLTKPFNVEALERALTEAAPDDELTQDEERDESEAVELRLYVLGGSPAASRAIANLERVTAKYDTRDFRVTIVDVADERGAHEAAHGGIAFLPTLVRTKSGRKHLMVGDLQRTAAIDRMLRESGVRRV